jgi:hypothetical protein
VKLLKMEKRLGGFCRWGAAILTVLAALWGGAGVPEGAEAYVMPSEQLLGFVANNFKGFKSTAILQSTRLMGSQGKEPAIAFEEKIWVKPPRFYRSQIVTEIEEEGMSLEEIQASRFNIDPGYRQLLAANSRQDLSGLLLAWGIDQSLVSLTRLDGTVAYAIGDYKDGTMPALLIEKKRFLPILLRYQVPGRPGTEPVIIRFQDFRRVHDGWYPFRIDCFLGQELMERYLLLEAKFNSPFPSDPFADSKANPASDSKGQTVLVSSEKGQIEGVIKAFKQKYDGTSP